MSAEYKAVASDLLSRLDACWSKLKIPGLDPVSLDGALPEYTEHLSQLRAMVNGRKWNEIDLSRGILHTECVYITFPPDARAYYFGAYIRYLLSVYLTLSEYPLGIAAGMPLGCISEMPITPSQCANQMTDLQVELVFESLKFFAVLDLQEPDLLYWPPHTGPLHRCLPAWRECWEARKSSMT